ncbi:uncharacterized protein LOC143289334 [Babylonia areolata]|uniref:uncharacterized protein LOC143289334 n=1 Tax=Babylonia areolata TaxID=304850 RepID=UPI003FD44672
MNGNATNVSYALSPTSESALVQNPTNGNGAVSSRDPVSRATVDVVNNILTCYVNPAVGACGVVGNLFNIIIFLVQKRSQPVNSLLLVLALVDTCYLVLANAEVVACVMRRYDVIAARNFTILTFPHVIWIFIALSRVSSMLTVVIAVERCVVVMMPLKAKMIVTPFTIRVTTAVACALPVVGHVPLFLRNEIEWRFNDRLNVSLAYLKLTPFALSNARFLNLYKNLVLNVLFRYVTMCVISVCTGVTIAQLKRYSRWRLSSVTSQADRATISERDARVSVTMSQRR